MKVGDLYVACVLLAAAGAVGWTLHEKWSEHTSEVERLRTQVGELSYKQLGLAKRLELASSTHESVPSTDVRVGAAVSG